MEAQEDKNLEASKKRGILGSIGVHILLLLLLFIPILSYKYPPPEQEGVLVSFGQPDIGMGNDRPSTQNEVQVEEVAPPAASEQLEKVDPVKKQAIDVPVEKNLIEKDMLTSQEAEAIALQEKKRKAAQEEAEQKARLQAAREQAAAEKARRQKEYKEAKKQFGNVFGKGKGNTGIAGNQGDPNGDPDASVLEGISTGSGVVGGGLGDRGVKYFPKVKDRTQKSGIVVIDVCVNQAGKVVSARYTQRGSTTTDKRLREIAIKNAKRFQFTDSDIDKQCGTITFNFKLE